LIGDFANTPKNAFVGITDPLIKLICFAA